MTDKKDIQVDLEALAVGGAMVGVISSGASELLGKKAFITGGVPGETVRARITKEAKGFVEAELVAIEKKSPDRVEAPCPYFAECGGCQLQQVPVALQRELKRDLVQQFLAVRRLTPRKQVALLEGELSEWSYRNRVTLHMNAAGEIGFYQQGSGDVVSIEACMIAVPAINEAIPLIKEACREVAHLLPSVVVEEATTGVRLVFKMHHDASEESVNQVVACTGNLFESVFIMRGRKVVFRSESGVDAAGHFSQVNSEANQILIEAVLARLDVDSLDDLYAGSGNFSLPLAAKGASVRAVELDTELVKRGRREARASGLAKQLMFVEARCEKFAKTEKLRSQVLLDPPRAGARGVVGHINPSETRKILYVSCNLPTFARDAAVLIEQGYVLEETLVLDMFPQTHHVELLSTFVASGS